MNGIFVQLNSLSSNRNDRFPKSFFNDTQHECGFLVAKKNHHSEIVSSTRHFLWISLSELIIIWEDKKKKKEKRAFHPIPKHLCVGRTINMNEKALRWLNKWNTPSRVCGWETRDTVFHHISNIEKRDENTMRNGVILMTTEVFRFWVERRRKDVEYESFNHISKQVKV